MLSNFFFGVGKLRGFVCFFKSRCQLDANEITLPETWCWEQGLAGVRRQGTLICIKMPLSHGCAPWWFFSKPVEVLLGSGSWGVWLANKGWFISPVSALTPYSPVGWEVAESTWGLRSDLQTNKPIWMYTVASWKRGGPVCFIVTRLPENKICRLCVQRKWNEWAGEPSSAYANECCDWLSLFLLSPATPSLQIRFQWEFFLFKDLLMVCNHLTINLTSELQAAQGGGCRKGWDLMKKVRIWGL